MNALCLLILLFTYNIKNTGVYINCFLFDMPLLSICEPLS